MIPAVASSTAFMVWMLLPFAVESYFGWIPDPPDTVDNPDFWTWVIAPLYLGWYGAGYWIFWKVLYWADNLVERFKPGKSKRLT